MAEPIYIDFLLRGMPAVQNAFKTVEQAASAAERSQTRIVQREAERRVKLAERTAERAIAADKRALMGIAKERERAGQAAQKAANVEQRIRERAARETIRNEERVQNEIKRIKERAAGEAERIIRKQETAAARNQRRQERAQSLQERDEYHNRRRFASHVAGAIGGGAMAGAQRVVGAAGHVANMVGQLGGGFSIDGAVERTARNSGDLEDLLNSGKNPTSNIESNRRRRESSEVLPAIQGTAQRWGLKREDVQGGMRAFTGATGDMETAIKLLPQLGEMARATGTDFHTLMEAAGGVGHVLDNVTDSGEKAEIIMKTLRTGAGQGKAGSFEMKDQAAVMSKIVAAAGKYEGKADDIIPELMALAQGARSGGGAWNAASAATSIGALTSTFGKGARLGAFKSEGIDVFTDKKEDTIRRPSEIIADAVDKTKGSIPRLTALFGSVMGMRSVNKMASIYKEAEEGKVTKDGKKLGGKEAILDWMHTMTKDAGMTKGDVSDAANRRMGSLDAVMASQREKFDAAVEEKVLPALLKLVPEFEKLVPMLVDLNAQAIPAFVDLIKTVAQFAETNKESVRWLAQHPIGAMIGGEIGKSLAQASIGEGVKFAIAKTLGDAGLGDMIGRALSTSVGKNIAAGGLIVATAALAIQQGMISIDNEYKADDKKRENGWAETTEAATLGGKLRRGQATEAEKKRAHELLTRLGADANDAEHAPDNPGLWKRAGKIGYGLIDPGEAAAADADERSQAKRQADEMRKSIVDLTVALRKNTEITDKNTKDGGTSGGADGSPRGTSIVVRKGLK